MKRVKINKKLIPVLVLAILFTGAVLYFDVIKKRAYESGTIEGSGTIEVTEIDIATKISGRVITLLKQEGESVSKGEIIARLEADELDAQRLSVLANLNNARKNMERIKKLFETGSISKRDFDNMETVYNVALSNFNTVNATINYSVLLAPIDGIVLDNNLEIGEMAFPGTPVVTVANLSRPWIKIYVSEKQLGRVRLGQKAGIRIDSFPKKEFIGKVVSISNKAEFTPKTIQTKDERIKLMFAVKIDLENEKDILKPGMPADAVIYEGEKK